MLQQFERSVGDEVDRRFVSGNQQQEGHRQQLVFAQSVANLFPLYEGAYQIIPQIIASHFEKPAQVAIELPDGRDDAPVRVELIDRYYHLRPLVKLIPVLNRHAQNFSDDGHWQRQSVIADQIHFSLPRYGVEQFIRQLLYPLPHPLDQARRERLMHELSQPRVIRRVEVEHSALQWTEHRRYPRLLAKLFRRQGVVAALGKAFIREQHIDVFVARHQPDRGFVRQRDAADGLFHAQTREDWERVRLKFRT